MGEKIFVENWQQQLELLFFENNDRMDKAYICSPLRADTQQEFLQNIHAARAYMFYVRQRLGFQGRAPHAYLPLVLCDFDPKEREMALKFWLELLEQSKVMLVCGNRISHGMVGEIVQAAALGKKIMVYDETLCQKARKIVVSNRGHQTLVTLDQAHPILAHPAPQECF